MIFEFFKKLFWRADESSRKRKSREWHEHEPGSLSKKSCQDLQSDGLINNSEFRNTEIDKFDMQSKSSHLSLLNSMNYQIKNDEQFDMLEKPMQCSSVKNTTNINKNKGDLSHTSFQQPHHESYSVTNFTLYKACQLIDRHKYSRMLLNFVNPNIECFQENDDTYNKNFTRVETPGADTKYVYFNHSIGDVLDLRNEFNDSLHPYCQDFSSIRIKNRIIQDDQFPRNVKTDPPSADLHTDIRSKNISTTNSLKKHLATKQVTKENFITKLTEKYNNSLEQRSKEAEEIKKMTHILAKHNRLAREAALEDHLNRSMRLCEVILDEADPLKIKLPELDLNMLKKIDSAFSSGPGNEILVQEFGLRIARKDIQTLAGLNWLNDEIINFYMNLLIKRGNCENYPTVYAMNTFFYPKLLSGGHTSLKRWTRKIDIFSKDLIVVPIHLGIHWCMCIIDFRNKTVQYYDSMGSPNQKCLQVLKQYLHDESVDKKKTSFEFLGWNFECMKDIPQQMNGSDCGVFSCMFAEYICANKKLDFSQDDMPYFRKKMVYEILSVQLL